MNQSISPKKSIVPEVFAPKSTFPDVLILDEPTDGLDPNQKHQVRSLIQEMAPNKAIVISTHLLEEVSAVCSRAIIISNGNLVFDGTPKDFAKLGPLDEAFRELTSEKPIKKRPSKKRSIKTSSIKDNG